MDETFARVLHAFYLPVILLMGISHYELKIILIDMDWVFFRFQILPHLLQSIFLVDVKKNELIRENSQLLKRKSLVLKALVSIILFKGLQ